jgi:hypothetical protein
MTYLDSDIMADTQVRKVIPIVINCRICLLHGHLWEDEKIKDISAKWKTEKVSPGKYVEYCKYVKDKDGKEIILDPNNLDVIDERCTLPNLEDFSMKRKRVKPKPKVSNKPRKSRKKNRKKVEIEWVKEGF